MIYIGMKKNCNLLFIAKLNIDRFVKCNLKFIQNAFDDCKRDFMTFIF